MPVNNFATGSKNDVGTTRAAIGTTSEVAKRGIQIVADPNNTVVVYVGDDTVTAGSSAPTTDGTHCKGKFKSGRPVLPRWRYCSNSYQ